MTVVRPCFIIHDLEHAKAAARVAAEAGVPVTLMSAPGGVAQFGPEAFQAIIEAARAAYPQADIEAVLDCSDEPGSALSALRRGARRIGISTEINERARAAIEDIAEWTEALVIDHVDESLDMGTVTDPSSAATEWIERFRASIG